MAAGGSGISVACVSPSQGSTPRGDMKMSHFHNVFLGSVGNLCLSWDFNAPEIDWVCESPGRHFSELTTGRRAHEWGGSMCYPCNSMEIPPLIFSP